MIVLAAALTGGAPGGHDSLIRDVLNGAESAAEMKAPSVPLAVVLGSRMDDKDTPPCWLVEYNDALIRQSRFTNLFCFLCFFPQFGDFSARKCHSMFG